MKANYRTHIQTSVLIAPWIITFLVFWLYPLIYAGYLSFTDYQTLTNEAVFIGFANYSNLFRDELFWQAALNTMIFVVGTVPVTTAFALLLASVINSKFVKFKQFFRASFFMPSVTSLVVISLIFTNLYARHGYINLLLQMAGIPHPEMGWLNQPGTALLSIMAMDVWIATGYYMILFLAGMQTIPNDLYDAARLAGASPWQQFRKITLPMLRSTLLFVVVINTIKSFQIFIEIFVMTKGGPLDSTMTLVYMVFVNAFEKTDAMGYAAALAYLLFIALIAVSFIQMKLLKERE